MNQYHITEWNESTLQQADSGIKLCQADITQRYEGTLSGTSKLCYQMIYLGDGTAQFQGYEWFEGSINGKSGSIVFHQSGEFKQGKARGTFTSLPESGTNQLKGVSVSGHYEAAHGRTVTYDVSED